MFKSNNKNKYLFVTLVFYGFTLLLSPFLINDLYANTNNNSHLIEEDHLDDEEDGVDDIEKVCPEKRKVAPAPQEYINKINPLRKEPRNLKKGKVLYRLKARKACKYCHGMEGKGDGSMADLMDNAPRNLTCKKYMNKITDGELFWVIKEGVVEGGMPSYKHLSDKKIWQLIQYIRTFSS
jgi:mono/diheme cytochrome c family protein